MTAHVAPSPRLAAALHASIAFVTEAPSANETIIQFLEGNGKRVAVLPWTSHLATRLAADGPEIALLDLKPHRFDMAMAILQERNRSGLGYGIIILAEHPDESDCVLTLEIGADDYVAASCAPRELLARIRVAMRRRNAQVPVPWPAVEPTVMEFGGWRYDLMSRLLTGPSSPPQVLAAAEHEVLTTLLAHAGQTLSREAFRQRNTQGALRGPRTIDLHISHLRKRFGTSEEVIATVWGRGYRLTAPVHREPALNIPA